MADFLDIVQERLAALGPPVRTVAGQRSSVPIRRYAEGRTSGAQLRAELHQLGYSGVQLERLALSADLELDLEQRRIQADTARAEFRRGLLDQTLLKARLIEAGFSEPMAALIVRNEVARAVRPVQRRSSIGLLLAAATVDVVQDRPTRRSSIGLLLTAQPGDIIREGGQRRSSIGLRLLAPPGAELPPPPERHSSIGLVLKARPEDVFREKGQRRSSIGLRLYT